MMQLPRMPAVMGILNVTPDSFYDPSTSLGQAPVFHQPDRLERLCERALVMVKEGADIIDIGGESTGPGSEAVSLEEELQRVIPVIAGIRTWAGTRQYLISVDTSKAEVARKALEAGAHMVNDITAGRTDPRIFEVVAKAGCPYVMMRSKDMSPRTTIRAVQYTDVMETIHAFFEERIAAAERAGLARSQLILDPGLGHFVSSDPRYSWEILEHLERLKDFGRPVLVSPSRKSFTARRPHEPTEERLAETLRATNVAIAHGASIIRTHDVAETRKIIDSFLAS